MWISPTVVFLSCFGAGLLARSSASSAHLKVLPVSLGQPVTLPCSGAAGSPIDWFFKQRKDNQWQLVIQLRDGGSYPGLHFGGRVKSVHTEKPGNYSLILDPMVYTDGGLFECKVHSTDRILSDVRLEVVVPYQVSVPVGESVTLQCYGNINKATCGDELNIRWQKDRKDLYHLHKGNATYEPGFESRVSVSLDRACQGDLSLTIKETRLSDQAEYRCFYDRSEENGQPPATRLLVTAIPPVDSSLSRGTVAAIVLVSLACEALVFILIWFYFKKRGWRANGENQNVPVEDRMSVPVPESGTESQPLNPETKVIDLQAPNHISGTLPWDDGVHRDK